MKINERVFTEYGPGEIKDITGNRYKIKLDIKPKFLKSDVNLFCRAKILSIAEYEKTLSQKQITETQLTLF